jgi:hypothetical protein
VARRAAPTRAADPADAGWALVAESFVVQEHPTAAAHLYLCCRHCKLTWFLPQDATRRTAEALGILSDHAVSHSALDRSAEQREHRSAP